MKVVKRKSDGAYVCAWVPDFPPGMGIVDAVNSGKGEKSDLVEIDVTEQEWRDNWYNREPREAAEIEAKIIARMDKNARDQAVAELKAEEEIPEEYQPKIALT